MHVEVATGPATMATAADRIQSLVDDIGKMVTECEAKRHSRRLARKADMAEFVRETEDHLNNSRSQRASRDDSMTGVMTDNMKRREICDATLGLVIACIANTRVVCGCADVKKRGRWRVSVAFFALLRAVFAAFFAAIADTDHRRVDSQ